MIKEIKTNLEKILHQIGINHFQVEVSFSKVGDFTSNIAMKLASFLKKSPVEIANEIIKHFQDENIEKIEVVKPGFMNFYLKNTYYQKIINQIITLKNNYGKGNQNKYINVEYVSVNPTGYLHAGHARGAIVGSVLSNLLKFAGNNVDQEYYINDAGNQIKILGFSTWIRYLQELNVEKVLPQDSYQGQDIIVAAKYFVKKYGDKYKNVDYNLASKVFEKESKDFFMKKIQDHLALIDIKMDIYSSEKELFKNNTIEKTLEKLQKNIYTKDGAIWLKTTSENDDKDRVLKKKDGFYTYFASDIAFHKTKIDRNYDELINIWGVDHIGYVPRMISALKLLGLEADKVDFLMINLVKLIKDNKEIKMSKRTGQSLNILELLDLIKLDALRFYMVNKSVESGFNLDLDLVKSQSSENPVFTIQYTNARCNQLLNKSKVNPKNGTFDKREIKIINKLSEFPELIIKIANNHKIHHLTQYLIDLCNMFNSFYSNVKVIGSEKEPQLVLLVKACQIIIKNCLKILNITSPEKM